MNGVGQDRGEGVLWQCARACWRVREGGRAGAGAAPPARLRCDAATQAPDVPHPARVLLRRAARPRPPRRRGRVVGRGAVALAARPDEAGELARLAEIERALLYIFGQFRQAKALIASGRTAEAEAVMDRALREASGNGFRALLDDAVAEEEEEAARAQARAEAELARVTLMSKIGAAAVALLGAGGLALLLRRLQAPLRELEAAAQAVRAGDFARRAEVGRGAREFARVAESFNAMVQEVAASRAGLEDARGGAELGGGP